MTRTFTATIILKGGRISVSFHGGLAAAIHAAIHAAPPSAKIRLTQGGRNVSTINLENLGGLK